MPTTVDRRTFLARAGVLGLALSAPPGLLAPPAGANPTGDALEQLVRWLRPQLQALSAETFDALVAFCVPGDDPFSHAQHNASPTPGAVAADAGPFLMDTIDGYLPLPDAIWVPAVLDVTRYLGNTPARLPRELRDVGLAEAQRLDAALKLVIENDETLPASIVIALLLNVTATILTPWALWRRNGRQAPFAKLSYREKARVFRDFERPNPKIILALGGRYSGALVNELNNLIKYLTMAMLALPADGTFSEQQVFDPATRTLRARPLGWDLSNYLPGRTDAPDGHDEFLGYYQGRQEVTA